MWPVALGQEECGGDLEQRLLASNRSEMMVESCACAVCRGVSTASQEAEKLGRRTGKEKEGTG